MTPQHIEALTLANVVRLQQTEVLRTLRRLPSAEAKKEAAHLLYEPTDIVGGIRLDRFLKAVPRVGEHKMRLLLGDAGFTGTRSIRRIRDLTERERRVLAGALHRDALGHERRRKMADRLTRALETAQADPKQEEAQFEIAYGEHLEPAPGQEEAKDARDDEALEWRGEPTIVVECCAACSRPIAAADGYDQNCECPPDEQARGDMEVFVRVAVVEAAEERERPTEAGRRGAASSTILAASEDRDESGEPAPTPTQEEGK